MKFVVVVTHSVAYDPKHTRTLTYETITSNINSLGGDSTVCILTFLLFIRAATKFCLCMRDLNGLSELRSTANTFTHTDAYANVSEYECALEYIAVFVCVW